MPVEGNKENPGEDLIAVCTECHSDQPDAYVERSGFRGSRHMPCKYCSGRVVEVLRKNRDAALKQADAQRGI